MFTFQIYFDFSGYSDMAIGLGKMFGFEYKENFNHPYVSLSVTDFWRRWHISLDTFFRDYVYIPLGGNKRHQMRNILIVWCYTMFVVMIGWTLFYFTDTNQLLTALRVIFGRTPYKYALRFPPSKDLEKMPVYAEYFYPPSSCNHHFLPECQLSDGQIRNVLEPEYRADSNLYNVFFGGDMPLAYLHSDVGNGKRIMIVRDSYGHAFLPFLIDHFEHIYAVESRSFNKEEQIFILADFMKDQGISCCSL